MGITGDAIAKKLGYESCSAVGYAEHVRAVKHEFLRRDYPNLLEGPRAIMDRTGSNLIWEQGLEDLYSRYPKVWDVKHFGNSAAARRPYAHEFLVAQAKKARSDITEEQKRAVAAAKRARERPAAAASAQRARGRKRLRIEPSSPGNHSSPSGQQSSPGGYRYSQSPFPHSPLPSPKRRKVAEKPNVQFKEFALILKGLPNPPATSYDAVWRFEDLLSWILKRLPALNAQRIVCWTELTIRDEEYSDMLGCALNGKCKRIISDQPSWDATVMAAQANRPNTDRFYGISIFACLETADGTPEHDEGDVIVLQDEVPDKGLEAVGRTGEDDEALGNMPKIAGGSGGREDEDLLDEERAAGWGEVELAREENGGRGPSPGRKKSVVRLL